VPNEVRRGEDFRAACFRFMEKVAAVLANY
jgi:hypothetical protein